MPKKRTQSHVRSSRAKRGAVARLTAENELLRAENERLIEENKLFRGALRKEDADQAKIIETIVKMPALLLHSDQIVADAISSKFFIRASETLRKKVGRARQVMFQRRFRPLMETAMRDVLRKCVKAKGGDVASSLRALDEVIARIDWNAVSIDFKARLQGRTDQISKSFKSKTER